MNKKFNSLQKQEGMTFIGIVLMFIFIGFLLLAVLRIFPLYYENLAAQKAIEGLVLDYKENASKYSTKQKIEQALQKRLDTQDVVNLKAEDIILKKSRNGFTMDASYKPVANYLANLNFMVEFDHVVELEK